MRTIRSDLTTGRVLYQYHTGTMTMKSEDLNEPRPGILRGDLPQGCREVQAPRWRPRSPSPRAAAEIRVRVKVQAKAVEGTVFIPFHFAQAAANKLTNAALDPVSGIPEYKVCAVKIGKAA